MAAIAGAVFFFDSSKEKQEPLNNVEVSSEKEEKAEGGAEASVEELNEVKEAKQESQPVAKSVEGRRHLDELTNAAILLRDLNIEPEYKGSGYDGDAWRRTALTSKTDKVLGWEQEGCKWAFYSARAPDCLGDIHRDYLVARKEVFESGGYTWSKEQVRAFDNDTQNLYILSAYEYGLKGDKDAGEQNWKPHKDARCRYGLGVISAKRKYALSVDIKERDALIGWLLYCYE